MPIIRADKANENYTQISNTCIYDKRLSGMAKAILLYMLSRPDDWQFYEEEIAAHFSDGISAVRSGINILIQYGYISRCKRRKGGRFQGYEYTVHECPDTNSDEETKETKSTVFRFSENGKTENGKTENGKTENGKSHTTNTDITNTDLTKTDLTNTDLTKTDLTKTDLTKTEDDGAYALDDGAVVINYDMHRRRFFSLDDAPNIKSLSPLIADFYSWYSKLYQRFKGEEHPRLTQEQLLKAQDTLLTWCSNCKSLSQDAMGTLKAAATLYFAKVKNCNHNILHFATNGILEHRGYEMTTQEITEPVAARNTPPLLP